MALASVEDLWQRSRRSDDDLRPYGNHGYQNYVPPNLAPRPFEQIGLRSRRPSWKEAPPPPPDPAIELLRWSIRRPGLAIILGYALWLALWSLYALQSYEF